MLTRMRYSEEIGLNAEATDIAFRAQRLFDIEAARSRQQKRTADDRSTPNTSLALPSKPRKSSADGSPSAGKG